MPGIWLKGHPMEIDWQVVLEGYDKREQEMQAQLAAFAQTASKQDYNAVRRAFEREKRQMDVRRRLFARLKAQEEKSHGRE
jgi:hypothetical protein